MNQHTKSALWGALKDALFIAGLVIFFFLIVSAPWGAGP